MGGDDADIPCCDLNKLDLTGRPTREGDHLLGQTTQAEEVVSRLIARDEIGRLGEGINSHAVLKHNDDAISSKASTTYGCHGGNLQDAFTFRVIP